jgi:hypothetical protein
MRTGRLLVLLLLPALCLLVPATAHGIWVIVDQGGGGDYTTITEALANAPDGAYVRVVPGTYSATTGETMPIQMRSGVTLQKHHTPVGDVIIDGEGLTRCMECVDISSTTRVQDMIFQNGYAASGNGGGLWIGGFTSYKTPWFHRCVFRDNHADQKGGGMYADHTAYAVGFNTCRFTSNTAAHGGGAAVQGPDPASTTNCVFDNNSVTGYGGGYLLDLGPGRDGPSRDLILQRMTFAHNSAGTNGAGVAFYYDVRLWNSIIAFSTSATDPVHTPGNISVQLECCDVYGNAGGDYVGSIAGQLGIDNNFWDNPDFCGVEYEPDDPYSISIHSPCAEENNPICGGVGGQLVKCGIPYLDVNLEWLEYYIPFGEQFCEYLVFTNAGDLPTDWQMAAIEGSMERGWGGPDAFGYRWGDSDKPDGPDFEWTDISPYGTQITLGDDEAEVIALPFEFPFYGTTYTECLLSSNGYLTFGTDGTSPSNTPLPTPDGPENIIAPFWTNLDPSAGGWIHTLYSPDAGTFTVQFMEVPIAPGPVAGNYTFQVVLFQDGTIRFYYLVMAGYTELATIGIENSDGTIGLEVAYNEPYMHDDLCVIIDLGPPAPQWFSMAMTEGTLDPGMSAAVECCADASELGPGTHEATLVLASDDYNYPWRYIPITVEVSGTGVEDATTRLRLRGNYPNPFNPVTRIAFDLPEPARVDLRVYNAAGRVVRTLLRSEQVNAGPREEVWDGRDDDGNALASGVYFCKLDVGGVTLAGKMVLLK